MSRSIAFVRNLDAAEVCGTFHLLEIGIIQTFWISTRLRALTLGLAEPLNKNGGPS